jgi:hypothetical protein
MESVVQRRWQERDGKLKKPALASLGGLFRARRPVWRIHGHGVPRPGFARQI